MTTDSSTTDEALVAAVSAEHLAELLAQPGLTYGSVGDGSQDQYVTLDGELLGTAVRRAPGTSPFLAWFAIPADGREVGPFLTARIAAAALMRGRSAPQE